MFLLFRVTPDVTPGTFKNLCEIDRKLSEARRDKEKQARTYVDPRDLNMTTLDHP